MADQSPSILVYVARDLLGDGLMKLPFLRALRVAWPQARITWLAGRGETVYGGVLKPLVGGLIDEVIGNAGIGTRLWELLSRPLPGRHFDLVIDTQRRVLTSLILKRLDYGLFISAAADWMLSDIRPGAGWVRPPSRIHQLLNLVALASGEPARPDAPLVQDPATESEADRRLPARGILIGLAPGAGSKHKCWPLDNYIALAMRQVKAGRIPVFFLGPNERHWENEIRDAVPTAVLPLDDRSCPLLTIALARRLPLVVVNDSGAAHLMAAAEVPLISLFGPTSPNKFAPLTPRLTIIRAQDFGSEAMASIPLQTVADTIDRLLPAPALLG